MFLTYYLDLKRSKRDNRCLGFFIVTAKNRNKDIRFDALGKEYRNQLYKFTHRTFRKVAYRTIIKAVW